MPEAQIIANGQIQLGMTSEKRKSLPFINLVIALCQEKIIALPCRIFKGPLWIDVSCQNLKSAIISYRKAI